MQQDEGFFALAGGVAELEMRAAPARQCEHAGVTPFECVLVATKSGRCYWVMDKQARVLFWRPTQPIGIDLRPCEAAVAGRWVSKVINLVAHFAQCRNDIWLCRIAPA